MEKPSVMTQMKNVLLRMASGVRNASIGLFVFATLFVSHITPLQPDQATESLEGFLQLPSIFVEKL